MNSFSRSSARRTVSATSSVLAIAAAFQPPRGLAPGSGVVTSRGDVHYVVTEHGTASLHGKSLRERALQLIAITDPRFRDELMAAARRRKLL